MPSIGREITKKKCVEGQKCPQTHALFFAFLRKNIFLLDSKKQKDKKKIIDQLF